MIRFRAVLLATVLAASSCASTATITVTAPDQAANQALARAADDEVALAAPVASTEALPDPMATVAPLPTVTPTPEPRRWVVVNANGEEEPLRADSSSAEGGGTTVTETSSDNDSSESVDAVEPEAVAQQVPAATYASSYPPGSCYTTGGWESAVRTPCEKPHRVEVVQVDSFVVPPGHEETEDWILAAIVESKCASYLETLGLVDLQALGLSITPRWAPDAAWDAGDYSYVCFARFDPPVSQPISSIIAGS